MENFLSLFNAVARVAKPDHQDFAPLQELTAPIAQSNLDSLDVFVLIMYLFELYGVDKEAGKDLAPSTAQDLWDFLAIYKTKEPPSVAAALMEIQ